MFLFAVILFTTTNAIFYAFVSFIVWDITWLINAGDWSFKDRVAVALIALSLNFICLLRARNF